MRAEGSRCERERTLSKKDPPKKPRTEYIYGTTAGKVTELIVSVDPSTGGITFGNDMTDVYLESSFERPKGPKPVYRIPQENSDITSDAEEALLKNFDFLCAVDTNTWTIQGKQVSAVGVITCREIVIPSPTKLERCWEFGAPFFVEFVGIRHAKPENLGWMFVLQQFWERGMIDGKKRAGLIVDSDLGSINDYNHGRKPVFENSHLPPNTKLIYASADKKDSIVNKALMAADAAATQTLDAIEKGLLPFNNERVDCPWYEGVRFITPNVISG
jgi:hypothetical protein